MRWFEGTVTEAVQTSKAKKTIFVVFIYGDDAISKEVAKAAEDKEVQNVQERSKFIAVKIHANSEDCGFFSQIYPVIVVPSMFFIGENGVPLEVIGGGVSVAELKNKMEAVVQMKKSEVKEELTEPALYTPPTTPEATATATVENKEENTTTSEDIQQRVARAEEMIERKREEKRKKEYEEMRKKEEDKRQLGKDLQKLKQFQKEREMQELQEQMKKDREADRIARQKVKEQIAKDRAERAAKYAKEKEEKDEEKEKLKQARLLKEQTEAAEAQARQSENARIQFRLPDGSSMPNTFPSTDTFQTVYDFIRNHVGMPVVLSTTFPRRTFSQADMTETLRDLQLAPSAVLLVTPERGSTANSTVSNSPSFLSLLFSPVLFLFNLLQQLFTSFTSSGTTNNQSSSSSTSSSKTRSGERNVHRFRNNQDDDDENATWNGNSTQQM